MGKSSKKSDAVAAVAVPTKSGNKGKREAGAVIEKPSAKKQKVDEALKQAAQKQKSEVKEQKRKPKKQESSSSEDDSSTSSDEGQQAKLQQKKGGILAKQPPKESSSEKDSSDDEPAVKTKPVSKNGGAVAPGSKIGGAAPKKANPASSSDSSESDSDEVPTAKAVALKKSKPSSSSDSSDSDSSDEEDAQTLKSAPPKNATVATKKGSLASSKMIVESSDSYDSESDAEEKTRKPVKKVISEAAGPNEESSDETESDTSSEEMKVQEEPVKSDQSQGKDPKEESSDETESDSSSGEEMKKSVRAPSVAAVPKNKDDSSDETDSDEEIEHPQAKKLAKATNNKSPNSIAKSDSDEDEDSGSSSESVEEKPSEVSNKSSGSDGDSSDDTDSEEDQPSKTPKRKDADVKMVDDVSGDTQQEVTKSGMKTLNTPIAPKAQSSGTKRVFIGNLSFRIEQADVNLFFEDVGEVVDVHFAVDHEGQMKGFGHVEFATADAAQKAVELSGHDLAGRPVKIDLARERGPFTPNSWQKSNSKGDNERSQTVFVRGFDSSVGADDAKAALGEYFGSCGSFSRVTVPADYGTGAVKGFAYIDFDDAKGFKNAIELDGSEIDGHQLSVVEARPKGDFRDSGSRGRDGGGRFGSRGRNGRFDGRGGGDGRFGGRSGRGRGRGRAERGGFNRQSAGTAPRGKKTTFGE